jgi:hypothetical protein
MKRFIFRMPQNLIMVLPFIMLGEEKYGECIFMVGDGGGTLMLSRVSTLRCCAEQDTATIALFAQPCSAAHNAIRRHGNGIVEVLLFGTSGCLRQRIFLNMKEDEGSLRYTER